MKDTRLRVIELLVPMTSRIELSEDKMTTLLAKAEILSQYIEQGVSQPTEDKPVKRRKSRGLTQV